MPPDYVKIYEPKDDQFKNVLRGGTHITLQLSLQLISFNIN